MKHIGRPATGQGSNKYIPLGLLGLLGVLMYLLKQGDNQTLDTIEALALARKSELEARPKRTALETYEERQLARKAA